MIDRFRWGGNLSATDADGADNRFFGAHLNGALNWRWNPSTTLETEFGLGFRNYYDFTGTVERDEVIWRAGTRLERQITNRWSWGFVVAYDRFASDNEAFDADRFEAGIITTYVQ